MNSSRNPIQHFSDNINIKSSEAKEEQEWTQMPKLQEKKLKYIVIVP